MTTQMQSVRRESRKFFNGNLGHRIGQWQNVGKFESLATCKICGDVLFARMIKEAGKTLMAQGCTTGLGHCRPFVER